MNNFPCTVQKIAVTTVLTLLVTLLGTACTKSNGLSTSEITQMKGAELDTIMNDKKAKENYLVIDVRTNEEYAENHVRYAINIVLEELESKLQSIEDFKDKNVVLICRSGRRSQNAAEILKKHGFTKLFNAEGVSSYQYTTLTKVKNIRGKELQDIVNAGTHSVIDARDEKDFNTSHLKGAIHATADTIMEKAAQLPHDKPVVTYCYSGNRSFVIAEKLAAAGYTVTNSLDGTKEYTGFELLE